jgi:hypothetical protein
MRRSAFARAMTDVVHPAGGVLDRMGSAAIQLFQTINHAGGSPKIGLYSRLKSIKVCVPVQRTGFLHQSDSAKVKVHHGRIFRRTKTSTHANADRS